MVLKTIVAVALALGMSFTVFAGGAGSALSPVGAGDGAGSVHWAADAAMVCTIDVGQPPCPSGPVRGAEWGRLWLAEHERSTSLTDAQAALLVQVDRNLAATEQLLALTHEKYTSDLNMALALAKRSAMWQAESLGADWTDPVPLTGYETPSAALLALADRLDVDLTSEQRADVIRLDQTPEPAQLALSRFVDAFLALHTALLVATEGMDWEALDEGLAQQREHTRNTDHARNDVEWQVMEDRALPASPGDLLRRYGLDLAPVFPARSQFLDATLDLHEALHVAGVPLAQQCDPIQVPPAFSIDLAQCDGLYDQNFALLLDAGGSDVYHNNAGGSNYMECVAGVGALVDLGDGDDRYGDPATPRRCGVNGGGANGGVGLLLDEAGDDEYVSSFNGGGGCDGVNGGGYVGGMGLLLDAGGNDDYVAHCLGVNGGGESAGVGSLVDIDGNDTYVATGFLGLNGGADIGIGFLYDAAGDDRYTATIDPGVALAANGGGHLGGRGFLLDGAGNDVYASLHSGTNGGGFFGGVGFLYDAGGDDSYTATRFGTNGGGSDGVGLLVDDGDGTDRYIDDSTDCWDCSRIPKGSLGAQKDSDE